MTVRLLAATSDVLAAALARGELDLFLGRIPEPSDRSAFDFEPLASEQLWVFAVASHGLARRDTLDWGDLGGVPWVLQPTSSPMRRRIEATFATAELPIPENLVETTSIFATLNLVRHANMVSMLPSTIVAPKWRAGSSCGCRSRPMWRSAISGSSRGRIRRSRRMPNCSSRSSKA